MLKGKKWIAFLTMFLFVAALTFLSRENGSAKRQAVWSNKMCIRDRAVAHVDFV